MIVTREDSFRGALIHTVVSNDLDTPCWPASELESALDADLVHLGAGWIRGVDFELLDGDDAFQLYEVLCKAHPAERPLPAIVLFPTGLTLACMDRPHGPELRQLLLQEAAEEAKEQLGRTRLERELGILYRDEEMQDRARKARALHRTVEAARRSGHLRDDDAGYVECMSSVAEVATGLRFPVCAAVNERVAGELNVPAWMAAATKATDRDPDGTNGISPVS
jgi:hypothetical protein